MPVNQAITLHFTISCNESTLWTTILLSGACEVTISCTGLHSNAYELLLTTSESTKLTTNLTRFTLNLH